MRKILICISIAVIAMIISVISFMLNDYHNYNTWMRQSGPQMMRSFPGWHRDDKRPKAPPKASPGDFRDDKEHHREPYRNMDRRAPGRPGPAGENQGTGTPAGVPDSTPAPAPDNAPAESAGNTN